jgi:hypothetical protein
VLNAQLRGLVVHPCRFAEWPLTIHAIANFSDFSRRLRLIDEMSPVRRERNGTFNEGNRRSPGGSPRQACPLPVLRAFDEFRAERISLDVSHDRQQMVVLLNQESLEPALPEPAIRRVLRVMPTNVCREQPLHPATHTFGTGRAHHEMYVIRHEASSKNGETQSLLRAMNQRLELLVISGLMEDAGFLVPAIDHVIAMIRDDEATRPWHGRSVFERGASGIT